MTKATILTGLRANNDLTIGNYFGAILPMIDMAKQKSSDYQINMFIPDLHSFTTPVDHSVLYDQILHNARLFAAAGLPLDNENIHLYRQSYIPAHSELTWILDCFTGFGEMSRMTQFKDKSNSIGADRTTVGLFNYPVLMAADILLYNAAYIPVGDDQTQHLEFTRDIAERMNNKFGDIFTVPEPVAKQHEFFGKDQGLRIKDLVDPTKKMSKSDDTGRGVIFLGDDPTAAAKKIMSATTDDKAEIHFDRTNQPGITNLLEILALLRGDDLQQTIGEFEGQTRYGDFKKVVADAMVTFLTDFQANLRAVSDEQVLAKLRSSEQQMTITANETLYRVQQAVGLRPKEN
ncbi:tryptophan--tRNA ligase [Streptomyces caniscabiei]|uniref:tryptophan--tRNA ligase n=1 Tax=Streptomyces caniscabiei TaxID=2746961 RepID=UPI0029A6B741|nr:tryptophan--tRNA ligase [Streptomyces caniscabiei]MDX2775958.1 tryptophan--tRNA ligase [Streptomyces caniscabiei]